MTIRIDNDLEKEFPCLMKNNIGQILLVQITRKPESPYQTTVIANTDGSFFDVGETLGKTALNDLHFLPKGYKVTIEN